MLNRTTNRAVVHCHRFRWLLKAAQSGAINSFKEEHSENSVAFRVKMSRAGLKHALQHKPKVLTTLAVVFVIACPCVTPDCVFMDRALESQLIRSSTASPAFSSYLHRIP